MGWRIFTEAVVACKGERVDSPRRPGEGWQVPAVHHVAVVVSDLARAERFYSGVLGLTVLERHTDDAGAPRSVWLALEGGAFLALERAGLSQPKRDEYAPGWHCVALAITRGARASWRQHLADAGHAVERETPYTLYVRDPDGALVALSHYPEK